MGNRCSRYWTRQFVDWFSKVVMFPLSALILEPHIAQNTRPIICLMGFLRAILPFAASFQGSRFGRQVVRRYQHKYNLSFLFFAKRCPKAPSPSPQLTSFFLPFRLK